MGTVQRETRITSFETHPSRYKHWKLAFHGPTAVLTMEIQEHEGLRAEDYQLKLNSYDMGVDMELFDAISRLRIEHPEVRAVTVTSGIPRVFCAGANIKMLASSTHAFKVNFCRFTNETRLEMEHASAESGVRFIAALNGTASGGGYELALACDQIWLIDDGNSAVSLPEVPLLGVLPGTGGLTRLVDKRKVRRDIADVFCTKAEGFRAKDALKGRLIDGSFPRSKWEAGMADVAAKVAASSPARAAQGVELKPLIVDRSDDGRVHTYRFVTLTLDPEGRVATIIVRAPSQSAPADAAALRAEGVDTWSVAAFRELEDALFHLRFNHETVGVLLVRTEGDPRAVLAHDAAIHALRGDWFADEVRYLQARVLRRIDNTARTFFAVVDQGSCFAGSLFELALAADRAYMLDAKGVVVQVGPGSRDAWPSTHGPSRLAARFAAEPGHVEEVLSIGRPVDASEALDLGLVTFAPDDIDWDDEIRIAIEERVSLSPDALTGMEQNLRCVGNETCDAKIFGRLSAWQNWIFQRPNAVGDAGALTLYGHPERPKFDFRRT